MNRRTFLSAATGLAGAAWLSPSAWAARLGEVHFEDELARPTARLKLLGTGLYYYKVFIKVAAVGLYFDEKADRRNVLADAAKRIEMQYFWGVPARDLAAGSDAMLAVNLSPERYAAVKEKVTYLHRCYEDVAAGDRVALEYVPAAGTTLSRNGKTLGTVAGADFAAAYFTIWLGERPMDDGLKRKLLGQ